MTTAEHVRRRQQAAITLGVLNLIALLVVIVVQFAIINPRLAASGTALCVFRMDLENRVAQTQKFLEHPEDFPAFSDPKTLALIEQQAENQQRTIATLSGLDCS